MLHKMDARPAFAGLRRATSRRLAAVVIFGLAAAAAAAQSEPAPLASVSVEGSTVYAPADFFAAYRDRLGLPATRESARAIAAAIVGRYQADGFARPEVRLDESLAAHGVMRISVFEPRITRVTIEGTPGSYRADMERIAAGVTASVPLRRDAIREAVSEMLRLPGLTVSASTRRDGALPNAHELVLRAEFEQLTGYARANNRGTEAVGPVFALGQVEVNDPFGWGGAFGLVVAAASDPGEYLSGAIYAERPLGGGGTRGTVMAFQSHSAPNERPVNLTDEYARQHLTLRVTRPANARVSWSASLESEDLQVDRDGTIVRDDRLRVLEGGLRAAWRTGEATQVASAVELRKGLDALGAGLRADDLANDPRSAGFLVTRLQLTSLTRMREDWSLRLDSFAQLSGDVLPDIERFKIGGERLGRGFEVAEIAGDKGLGGKVTLRRELGVAALTVGRPAAYGFYDIGAAWKNDAAGRESASTMGAGVALQGGRFAGYLELAKPLRGGDVEGKRGTSLFAELSCRF